MQTNKKSSGKESTGQAIYSSYMFYLTNFAVRVNDLRNLYLSLALKKRVVGNYILVFG